MKTKLSSDLWPLIRLIKEPAQDQAANDAAFIVESLGIGIWKWDIISNTLAFRPLIFLGQS